MPKAKMSVAKAVRWAATADAEYVQITEHSGKTKPVRVWARALPEEKLFLLVGDTGKTIRALIDASDKETFTVRPAHIVAGKLEEKPVYKLVMTGYSPRGEIRTGTRWKVGQLLNPRYNLIDGLCLHSKLGRARECLKAREAGASKCIDHTPTQVS